ncbi:MAG TPA: hypothetical protein VEK08_23590 [Planctomycetota bacterium]|nr:hypothetical protein [Planctomycetota bacterium]
MAILDFLPQILDALIKEKTPFALTGGLASNLWLPDEQVRETFDIDFAVPAGWSPDQLATSLRAPPMLAMRGADLNLRRAEIKRLVVENIVVDFVSVKSAPFMKEVFARVQTGRLAGRPLPVLSPEDIFVFKAISKRERDIQPMSALATTAEFDRKHAEKWCRKFGVWLFAARALKSQRTK